MSNKQILLMAGGILLIVLGLALIPVLSTEDKTAAVKNDTICPDCGKPLPKSAQVSGECPYCKTLKVMEGKDKQTKESGSSWNGTDYFIVLMILFLVLGGGFLIVKSTPNVSFFRSRYAIPKYICKCPNCKRKIRYSFLQAGKDALCPSCEHVVPLPAQLKEAK